MVNDSVKDLNEKLDAWVDEKKPIIIKAKMQAGYYKYEVLITYDDNKEVTL